MTTIGVVPPSGSGVISGLGTITDYDTRERSSWSSWVEESTPALIISVPTQTASASANAPDIDLGVTVSPGSMTGSAQAKEPTITTGSSVLIQSAPAFASAEAKNVTLSISVIVSTTPATSVSQANNVDVTTAQSVHVDVSKGSALASMPAPAILLDVDCLITPPPATASARMRVPPIDIVRRGFGANVRTRTSITSSAVTRRTVTTNS